MVYCGLMLSKGLMCYPVLYSVVQCDPVGSSMVNCGLVGSVWFSVVQCGLV